MADASRRKEYKSAILSTLKQFHEQGKYWDVRVQVDAEVFKCQRAILAANSEYFDDKFSRGDNSQESNATAHKTITLPDNMDAEAFQTLLRFMYTGEVCAKDCNIHQLFVLSDFLRLRTDHFKERTVQFVNGCSSEESEPMSGALDLLRYACDKEENVLVEIMCAHVCRHLYQFLEDAQLMQLSFEHLNALLKHSKNCIVPLRGSADVLMKVVYDWVNCNREVRSQYRVELMKNIDFANVSSDLALSLMNRSENVVDEVSKVSGVVRSSFPKLESLEAALEGVHLGISTGLRGIISLNVPHISEVRIGGETPTASCMISNLLWEVSLERSTSDELDICLGCKGTDLASEWNVYAGAEFTIKSHKEEVEDRIDYLTFRLFSSSDRVPRSWVMASFLPWNELVDPEKGYIADDSLFLEVHTVAGVPFLNYNPQ